MKCQLTIVQIERNLAGGDLFFEIVMKKIIAS
jgi:hypothetical protein